MELGSGAGVSILQKKECLKVVNTNCLIKPTNIRLKIYYGLIIEPVGEINVNIEINNIEHETKLVKVKSENIPLLSIDLMKLFSYLIWKY
jgi:hypothetical protein